MSKYGVFSGPYFPVFSPNTGKYGPEKTPYLDTFNAVKNLGTIKERGFFCHIVINTVVGLFQYGSCRSEDSR